VVRAVILDADSVLVRPERIWSQQLEHQYRLNPRAFTEFIFHGEFQNCLIGRADLKEVLSPVLEQLYWTRGAEVFIREWLESEHALDAALLEHIAQIRASGIPCYLATNQERYRTAYLEREMGLGAVLDGIFSSSTLGFRKPSLEYYQAIQTQLELGGSQILFWDDTLKNVEAARAAGWNAELYTSLEGFETVIRAYSLLEPKTN